MEIRRARGVRGGKAPEGKATGAEAERSEGEESKVKEIKKVRKRTESKNIVDVDLTN